MGIISGAFIDLGLVLIVALAVLSIVKFFRQPMIVGYIAAGVLCGPLFFNLLHSREIFAPLASLGVSILLFVVGLNLNPRSIKGVEKAVFVTGLGQLLFTFVVGYFIARLFEFNSITSIFIGLALSLSSTIAITKFLTDREQTGTLYGKITIGFILLQDLVHILILIFLMIVGKVSAGASLGFVVFETILKSLAIIVGLLFVGIYIFPSIMRLMAKSHELLLVFSLGWAIVLVAIFDMLGFIPEVGALAAGIILSFSPYKYEINSKLKSFRDFFLLIFFIWLGALIEPLSLKAYAFPIIVFSLFVLIGTPIVVMFFMGSLGYTRRNSFLTGITVAHISEFSLILIASGVIDGFLSPSILTIAVAVGLLTMAGSSYAIEHSNKLYQTFSNSLRIFEIKGRKKDEGVYYSDEKYDIILFGYNRIGFTLKNSFEKMKKSYIVVDNNPEVVQRLAKEGVNCRYGDAENLEMLGELPLKKVKVVISTIPEFETNLILLEHIRAINKDAIIIIVSHQIDEALKFYEMGATYVVTPHFLGGTHTAHLLESYGLDHKKFKREGASHINELLRRKKEGHRDVIHHRG